MSQAMSNQKLSDEELEVKLVELQRVIVERGDMPENIDRILLLRFLKFFNGNVEKALRRLITNMELRKSYSNIFYNRDTLDPNLRKLIEQVEMVPLPIVTAENNRILILRLIDFNSDNLVFDDALSVWSMVYDTSMITPDTGSYADGEVIIFDVKGLSAKHLTRFGLSSLKCYLKYMIEAHPIRIKQIHVLNSHAILDKLMIILRPFLGAKAMKVIHFHVPNSSTLYDFVPRDVLPDELGGTIGTITTPKWYWIHRTEDHRDYLLDDGRWKIKETKAKAEHSDEEALNYLGFC